MTIWDTALSVVFQAQMMLTGAPLGVVMDAYFAKACMFNALRDVGVTLITRLRHDAVGWEDPVYCGRGRPPTRGPKWSLRLSKKSEIISNHKFLIHLNPCVSQSPSHAVDGGQSVRKKAKEGANNTGQSPSFLLI